MANIAQIANVLQSMVLTNDKGQMVLTPTYHVFKMYNVHQDATHIPLDITCDQMDVRDNRTLPLLSATASKDANGVIHISLSNVDLKNEQTISIDVNDLKVKNVTGEILTSKNIADHNTFENPNTVNITDFKGAKLNKGTLQVKIPAKSIVTLALN